MSAPDVLVMGSDAGQPIPIAVNLHCTDGTGSRDPPVARVIRARCCRLFGITGVLRVSVQNSRPLAWSD